MKHYLQSDKGNNKLLFITLYKQLSQESHLRRFSGLKPAFAQWKIPFGQAEVPGSSDPSSQSQKSSFTWSKGIVAEPSKQVNSPFAFGWYRASLEWLTPLGDSLPCTRVSDKNNNFIWKFKKWWNLVSGMAERIIRAVFIIISCKWRPCWSDGFSYSNCAPWPSRNRLGWCAACLGPSFQQRHRSWSRTANRTWRPLRSTAKMWLKWPFQDFIKKNRKIESKF